MCALEVKKEYKLEVYCEDFEDLKMLMDAVQTYFVTRPQLKRLIKPMLEIARVKVEHWHFKMVKIKNGGD